MRQRTLLDSFESAKKNDVGRERKRCRNNEKPDELPLGFVDKVESSLTEEILPPHFFSLCSTEHYRKVCELRRQQRGRISFLQHQNMQKSLTWNNICPNEDGRVRENGVVTPLLIQNVYNNSIVDISSDSSGQVFFALQRSGFNLFSSSFVREDAGSTLPKYLILRLDSNNIREHRQADQSRAFIFSCSQFIGNSLFAACGYFGTPTVEVFDLEDVDEATCDPICSFSLNQIQRNQESNNLFLEEDAPFATDIVSLSNNLSVSGLSSGESAWIDLRQKVAIQCTPRIGIRSKAAGLLDIRLAQQRPSPLSSVAFSSSSCSLLITGAKDGRVSLWDVRNPKDFIASYRSRSEIARLWTYTGNGERMGCPQIWFNNYGGDITGLTVSNDSFSEIFSLKTEDFTRDSFSSNIAIQKLALSNEGYIFYPHVSKNCVLALDIEVGVRNFLNEEIEAASFGKSISSQPNKNLNSDSRFAKDPTLHLDHLIGSKALRNTFSFSDTYGQISACSVFDDQLFLLVGSSVGDLCLIKKDHIH